MLVNTSFNFSGQIEDMSTLIIIFKYGQEFWYARELQVALEYKEWRNFKKVIDKATQKRASSN